MPENPPAGRARPAALLAVRIARADVGARVTVRHRLHGDPAASLTDVVGRLVAWSDDDVLEVERRDGTRVGVRLADVVAAKVVPDTPGR